VPDPSKAPQPSTPLRDLSKEFNLVRKLEAIFIAIDVKGNKMITREDLGTV